MSGLRQHLHLRGVPLLPVPLLPLRLQVGELLNPSLLQLVDWGQGCGREGQRRRDGSGVQPGGGGGNKGITWQSASTSRVTTSWGGLAVEFPKITSHP